jgi:hypothetical protein
MRIIKGMGKNKRKYEKDMRKTKKKHDLPSHYHYYAMWTMRMNVCCNEDVKVCHHTKCKLVNAKNAQINF